MSDPTCGWLADRNCGRETSRESLYLRMAKQHLETDELEIDAAPLVLLTGQGENVLGDAGQGARYLKGEKGPFTADEDHRCARCDEDGAWVRVWIWVRAPDPDENDSE